MKRFEVFEQGLYWCDETGINAGITYGFHWAKHAHCKRCGVKRVMVPRYR